MEGLHDIGKARVGTEMKAFFSPSKACCSTSVQSNGCVPPVLVYRGLAISENAGIYRRQYPTAPRNSQTCFLVVGMGICKIVSIWLRERVRLPLIMWLIVNFPQYLQQVEGHLHTGSGYTLDTPV